MPYLEPDETDPMDLNGMVIQTDEDVTREMADCFIMEYMRLGYPADRIIAMFQLPLYIGPYRAWQSLGGETISAMIDDCAALWNGRRTGGLIRRDEEGHVIP